MDENAREVNLAPCPKEGCDGTMRHYKYTPSTLTCDKCSYRAYILPATTESIHYKEIL